MSELYKPEAFRMTFSDGEIAVAMREVERIARTVQITEDKLARLNLVAFQGFDPRMVIEHMARVKLEEKMTDEEFESDLIFLCGLYIMMGNVTRKNTSRMSEEGKNEIIRVMKKWRISAKTNDDKLGSKIVLTVPRVAAAFPILVSQMAGVVSRSYAGPFKTQLLPHFMRVQTFASLIPQVDAVSNVLVPAMIALAADTAYVISGDKEKYKEKKAQRALFAEQTRYVKAAFEGSVVSFEDRRMCMAHFKVMDYKENIYSIVEKCIEDDEWSKADFEKEMADIQAEFERTIQQQDDLPVDQPSGSGSETGTELKPKESEEESESEEEEKKKKKKKGGKGKARADA